MAFKLRSGNTTSFKKMGSSALKANPYADAKAKDANLDSYIKTRNANEVGSEAYETAQAKINAAYGKTRVTKGSDDTVAGKRINKPAAKPSIKASEIATGVEKPGLQTTAPGKAGNVDKSHGDKTGSGKSGNVTTKKSNKDKSDTLVESQGRTKGGSTVVASDYKGTKKKASGQGERDAQAAITRGKEREDRKKEAAGTADAKEAALIAETARKRTLTKGQAKKEVKQSDEYKASDRAGRKRLRQQAKSESGGSRRDVKKAADQAAKSNKKANTQAASAQLEKDVAAINSKG